MPNHYLTSTGERITQTQINSRLAKMRNSMMHYYICQCCWVNQANDHDHTISQKRCKELHKTELIWDEANISFSCRGCHIIYENFKTGGFQLHKNWLKRILFIKLHDNETYMKRFYYLSDENKKIINEYN